MLLECVSVSTPVKKKSAKQRLTSGFSINQSRGTAFLPYSFLQLPTLIWEGQLLLPCCTSENSHVFWLKQNCCQCFSPLVSHLRFDCSLCFPPLASYFSYCLPLTFLHFNFFVKNIHLFYCTGCIPLIWFCVSETWFKIWSCHIDEYYEGGVWYGHYFAQSTLTHSSVSFKSVLWSRDCWCGPGAQ